MRDISSIKERIKETQPQLHPTLQRGITYVKQEEITNPKGEDKIKIYRSIEVKKDPFDEEVKRLNTTRKKFNTNIQIKQKELGSLVETIQKNRQLASDEIEKVFSEAKAEANRLISRAESTKNEADNLLERQNKRQIQLDELEIEINKREINVDIKKDLYGKLLKETTKDREQAQKNLLLTDNRYQEALQAYISAVSLLSLVIDHLKNLQKIRDEVSEATYQSLSKVGIIYDRAITLMKLIDGDKLLLQQRAIELQAKEAGLIDREKTLQRSAKELDYKIKNYGQ